MVALMPQVCTKPRMCNLDFRAGVDTSAGSAWLKTVIEDNDDTNHDGGGDGGDGDGGDGTRGGRGWLKTVVRFDDNGDVDDDNDDDNGGYGSCCCSRFLSNNPNNP